MKNPNTLIAMALVSQNASNPYAVFCEYIKYCIFKNVDDVMMLTEIRDAVSNEFGLYIPYNIAMKCLLTIQKDGFIALHDHQIKRTGTFDTNEFENERDKYREIENSLIEALINYVAKYGKTWTFEYAREQLINVLDKNGLAYDIFIHGKLSGNDGEQIPDEEAEVYDVDKQPLYSDIFFVGKFVEQTLSTDSIQKSYLHKICAGLMLCMGAYQLPSADAGAVAPQIKNTEFFFDTRLLLRYVGCAGEAAVEATVELANLIQSGGGKIFYYPQTLEEMKCAFDDAIRYLVSGYPIKDNEMRIFSFKIKNEITVLQAKKATIEKELARAKIYLMPYGEFSDSDQIRFGFDRIDLQEYMKRQLLWDQRTIENDAYSLWETHMRRAGDYSEYCGTKKQLPVFVTTNSRLMSIAIEYREARQSVKEISGWKPNRLPVITDIKLTCRLWVPSEQCERLSLLYLTANAVAAQRPTTRYLNTVRNLAIELEKTVPEYSGVALPVFFEDEVTNALMEHTHGLEDNFNISTFADTIDELTWFKVREKDEIINQVKTKCDEISMGFDQQSQYIIEDAVDENKNKLWPVGIVLRLVLWWPTIMTLLFAGVSSLLSYAIGTWHILWVIVIPMVLAGIEIISKSNFIKRRILKKILPKVEAVFEKQITKNIKRKEQPYKDIIIQRTKEETELLVKCNKIIEG